MDSRSSSSSAGAARSASVTRASSVAIAGDDGRDCATASGDPARSRSEQADRAAASRAGFMAWKVPTGAEARCGVTKTLPLPPPASGRGERSRRVRQSSLVARLRRTTPPSFSVCSLLPAPCSLVPYASCPCLLPRPPPAADDGRSMTTSAPVEASSWASRKPQRSRRRSSAVGPGGRARLVSMCRCRCRRHTSKRGGACLMRWRRDSGLGLRGRPVVAQDVHEGRARAAARGRPPRRAPCCSGWPWGCRARQAREHRGDALVGCARAASALVARGSGSRGPERSGRRRSGGRWRV